MEAGTEEPTAAPAKGGGEANRWAMTCVTASIDCALPNRLKKVPMEEEAEDDEKREEEAEEEEKAEDEEEARESEEVEVEAKK